MNVKLILEPTRQLNQSVKLLIEGTSGEALKPTVAAGQKLIVERASEYCPVDKGNLKKTIRRLPPQASENRASGLVTAGGMVNGFDVDYAGFVEFGTSKMAAQPFLRPAVEDAKEQALAEMGGVITHEIFDPRLGRKQFGIAFPGSKGRKW